MSSLKVHVWENVHVSLEVAYDRQTTYISYWEEGGCKDHQGVHFHTEEEDAKIQGTHTIYELTTLQTIHAEPKIQESLSKIYQVIAFRMGDLLEAYNQFKNNPEMALWTDFLCDPYDHTSSGITAYLLDKGGIFDHVSYKKTNPVVRFFQVTALFGAASAVTNFISSRNLLPDPESLSEYIKEYSMTIQANAAAKDLLVKIMNQAQPLSRVDTRFFEISHYANRAYPRIVDPFVDPSLVLTNLQKDAIHINNTSLKIAWGSLFITGISLAAIRTIYRYIFGQFQIEDVAILAQKACSSKNQLSLFTKRLESIKAPSELPLWQRASLIIVGLWLLTEHKLTNKTWIKNALAIGLIFKGSRSRTSLWENLRL